MLEVFASAPAERRNRAWRRRRLLVLRRTHPKRFRRKEKVRRASAGRTEPRVFCGRVVKARAETAGEGGGDEGAEGVADTLAIRVAGLEEEDIFRKIILFL